MRRKPRAKKTRKPKLSDRAVITVGERAFFYISFALLWIDKIR